jgi:hypothetical protein
MVLVLILRLQIGFLLQQRSWMLLRFHRHSGFVMPLNY